METDKQIVGMRLEIAQMECESAATALEFVNYDKVVEELARVGRLAPPADGEDWDTHLTRRKDVLDGQIKTLREAARILKHFRSNLPKVQGGEG